MMVKSILLALTILVAFVLQAEPSASQTADHQLGTVSGADPSPGWNVFHLVECFNSGNTFIAVTVEGGLFLNIFDPLTQIQVLGACQTGNQVGVFFNSPSTFTAVITVGFK
jgi:hypothetical protein